MYNTLLLIRDMISKVYLENINLPTGASGVDNQYSAGANLLINSGIWQGWLMVLGLPVVLIRPQTWQALHGLFAWKKRLEDDPTADTPLILARRSWPEASLEFKADDGQAVGLLLAALAYQDAQNGIDRAALQAVAQQKKQRANQEARKLAKAARALPGMTGDPDHGYF